MEDNAEVFDSISNKTAHHLRNTLRTQLAYLDVGVLDRIVADLTTDLRTKLEEQAPAIEASKSRINFFSLPPEIRNEIYELAFISMTPGCKEEIDEAKLSSNDSALPALLHTSRQVRQEASPIYYSTITFLARAKIEDAFYDEQEPPVKRWLEALGPQQASKIKRLGVKFPFQYTNVPDIIRFGLGQKGLPINSSPRAIMTRPDGAREEVEGIYKVDMAKAFGLDGLGIDGALFAMLVCDTEWVELELAD